MTHLNESIADTVTAIVVLTLALCGLYLIGEFAVALFGLGLGVLP
jgi:hypothetical protein